MGDAELYTERGFGGVGRGERPGARRRRPRQRLHRPASPLCATPTRRSRRPPGCSRPPARRVRRSRSRRSSTTRRARGRRGVHRKSPALRTLAPGTPWPLSTTGSRRSRPSRSSPSSSRRAFFGTPLAAMLAAHGTDTVVVCGASTSGCVRATAVDALQHGYRVVVPREAVADRAAGPHDAALLTSTRSTATSSRPPRPWRCCGAPPRSVAPGETRTAVR